MKYNDVDIYVFSGTGNTLIVANKIAEILNSNSYNANIYRIEGVNPQNISIRSTIAIGFTTAFWNTFTFVRRWIDNLPNGNGAEVFLFTTMGDSTCGMLAHISKILEKKNYKIIGSQNFKMPNNFLLVLKDSKNKERIENTLNKIELYIKNIIANNGYIIKSNIFSLISYTITNFIVMKLLPTKLVQKMMKFKIDKNKCIKCGICVKLCPTQNIGIKDIPTFKNNCQFCLRCVSYCPQQAMSNKMLLKTYRALTIEDMLWKKH